MDVQNYLFSIPPHKIKLGLDRTEKLLEACGNPHHTLESIQLVGTNGKGSTSSFLANSLSLKYKVGLFTSPHLVDYKERIRVNSNQIQEKDVLTFIEKHKKDIEKIKPSFFEIMTVLAMWYFKINNVDICVLETGLGGRLDSVTACENSIVAFTNIDLDHQSILGETIEKITTEKSEAITQHTKHVFCLNQNTKINTLIKQKASQFNLKINFIDNVFEKEIFLYLLGRHQQINASLAFDIVKHIYKNNKVSINLNSIKASLLKTKWPGRFQIINQSPDVVFDVAHNSAGINSFVQTLEPHIKEKNYIKKTLICAFENNKKINDQIKSLTKNFDEIICVETGIKKSMSAESLALLFNSHKTKHNYSINAAFKKIKGITEKKHLICIIGTHYFGPFIHNLYNKSFAKI